jgi:signal transduction histidine kinase
MQHASGTNKHDPPGRGDRTTVSGAGAGRIVRRGSSARDWAGRARTLFGRTVYEGIAVVPTLLAMVVLIDLVVVSATGSWLAMAVTLAQLPLIVLAAVLHARRCSVLDSTAGLLEKVGSHAEEVEAALIRDEETLHEVRATVVGLSLAVHLLQEADDDFPEATRTRLESLHASELERLERLLTEGPREEPRSVALADVVDPFVDSVRTRGQRVLWGGTHCRAWGRRDEIAEIVHVLLENAARHASGADVAVEVSSGNDHVELRVADLGPGVPPELAETLFERGTRGRQSPGDGIGLHLAQRLSREMGGDLRLERSVPGAGAAFALTLPTDRTTQVDSVADRGADRGAGQRVRNGARGEVA